MMIKASRRLFLSGGVAAFGAAMVPKQVRGQIIETGRYRAWTGIEPTMPYLGQVRPRSTTEIAGSNWLLGCEVLDRDYADYDQYKEFIAPLGIKRLRLQGGWAKTEKVKGQFDFAWLDHIVNDAVARGFMPWLQTSYGNALYPGGGGTNLSAGLPTSAEALAAYDRWVTAMATRYKDKVFDWEVWNEPNFGDNALNTPEATADFNVRTAKIIKRIQPGARISGLALGHYNRPWVDRFFKRLNDLRGFPLFDNMTYHDYAYNPDGNVHEVAQLRAQLDRYAPAMRLRQGENGAPSGGGSGRGALWDYPWSELTQAKWKTRRMLRDLGQDIESSVFSIVEMNYSAGPINRRNFKGILKVDGNNRVVRPKTAYYAIQHLTSIFDNTLERIRTLEELHTLEAAAPNANALRHSTDRNVAAFGYRNRTSGKHAYSLWLAENIPAESNAPNINEIGIVNADIDAPVWIDIISGAVHEIPASQVSRKGNITRYQGIPLYDAPIVLADKSLVQITA